MDSKRTHRPRGREGGYVLVAVAALTTVLLATGIAFMRWSTDEGLQSREAAASMQAYYLAQMGIVEEGFMWLRSQKETELPTGDINRPGRVVSTDPGNRGEYQDVHVYGMPNINEDGFWAEDRRFRISAVGKVRYSVYHDGQNEYKDIYKKAVLYVQVRNFADYMYLSNWETTTFGDRIKFWHGDTLQGRVHSNDLIAIMQDPQFYGQVSTCAHDFWRGAGYNPGFHGPLPIFDADSVLIPNMADNLRRGAATQGNFYSVPGKSWRVELTGGTAYIYSWDTGTPFDSSIVAQPKPLVGRICFFFDGPTDLMSGPQGFTGQVTVGSSHNVRIIDNVAYADAYPLRITNGGRVTLSSRNILGIVSEADVKVGNTPANGRADSKNRGLTATNLDCTSVFITGAIVALGNPETGAAGSFSFEQQNDIDSGYVYQFPAGVNHRDDRGTIYLYGSLTQKRRGYVHRSTSPGATPTSSTGYLKQYRYDQRFDGHMKPPCFFHVTDASGHALFNIVQWGQGWEDRNDKQRWKFVRYN